MLAFPPVQLLLHWPDRRVTPAIRLGLSALARGFFFAGQRCSCVDCIKATAESREF